MSDRKWLFMAVLAALSAPGIAGAEVIDYDYSVEYDFTLYYIAPQSLDCANGRAGVTIRGDFFVGVGDLDCPQNLGLTDKGQQLLIVGPDSQSRSVPARLSLSTPYHIRIISVGSSIRARITDVGELAWDNAPVKPGLSLYPVTESKNIVFEVLNFKVSRIKPVLQPPAPVTVSPNIPPAPLTPPFAPPDYTKPMKPPPSPGDGK
jgi:hypothetical protein